MGKKKNRNFEKKVKQVLGWDSSLRVFLAGFIGLGATAYSDVPVGLIGGETALSGGYAALLADLNGNMSPISGLPSPTSQIVSVAMNLSGEGLIGGNLMSSSIPYAASIAPDGTLTPIPLTMSAGYVKGVAINETGFGLIGGRDNGLNNGYVAQVIDGVVVPCSVSVDYIEGISLNDAGVGLVGGEGGATAYAAFIDPNGMVNLVPDMPPAPSHLYAVAINNLGKGIIGGIGEGFSNAYAAFVYSGASPILLNPVPSGTAFIYTVAINESGAGLIGGVDASSNAYAGYAAPNGDVTAFFNSPFNGLIRGVAINDDGVGLIGGSNGLDVYAAFVRSDGSVTPLFTSSLGGIINAVAINDAGVGLIGGQVGTGQAYAALAAPNGTLTRLDTPEGAAIFSVALNSQEILNQVTPQSIGPFGSTIYTQLAATAALENRLIQQNQIWNQGQQSATNGEVSQREAHLVYNEMNPNESRGLIALNPKNESAPFSAGSSCGVNSIWLQPFGDFIHLKGTESVPNLTNQVGGVLLGYDRQGDNFLVGTTAGYAFNYVHYSNGLGHSKVQEEMLSLYGVYYTDHFSFVGELWGGLYQLKNVRHTLSLITSQGKTHGWILQPHIELRSPWAIDQACCCFIEPFVQFDWVNNWQKHYTETGSSGLNVHMPSIYNSLLHSEIGLRFYEKFTMGCGEFRLEEKLSYVNQAPFDVHSVNTSFVSSASTFPVAVASSNVQNLGSVQLLGCFVPWNSGCPYGGFSVQATAGSSYQSYFVSLFTGLDF